MHDARSSRLLEDLVRDVRHMARGLRKSPGFTIALVLTGRPIATGKFPVTQTQNVAPRV
jgi:hypothetical protein